MYQFYYAKQVLNLPRGEIKLNIRDHFQITKIRPSMWEEHCLECSAPQCFESCLHYQARSDGRCKRFENGMLAFQDDRACCGQGVRVKFYKWGNMMTHLFPAMLTEEAYAEMWERNRKLGNGLNRVESSALPRNARWGLIRGAEFIRRKRLYGLTGSDNVPDAFVFHAYSYSPESYRLILEVAINRVPSYKTAITIHPGENLAVISDAAEEADKTGSMIRLYPEKDLEAELDILWCDFVQGTPIVSEKPADKVKCVVWDLDNTLWNGTLIETEAPEKLLLKPGVRELMTELDQRGIIQSIASKNDVEPAMAVLENLGIREYFLYPQIHWDAKSSSMEQIAKSLNIGIDSLAFIDDTEFERRQVSTVWPQVRTYDAEEVKTLLERPEFCVPVTAESRARRSMYQAEEKRSQLQQIEKTDIADFIRRCNLKLRIFTPTTHEELLRCYELVVRTNQLNMTGIKYDRDGFDSVLKRPGRTNFAFSCGDDFGEYGIVGFGQYHISDGTMIFDEFAMSCRAAGKFVESALFSRLLNMEKAESGVFPVIKTKKNILLRNTLQEIGFLAEKETDTLVTYFFTEKLKHCNLVKIL